MSALNLGAADEAFPHLFSPIQLGTQTFRNRIAFASLFSGRARAGEVTPELVNFYESRAKGGAALIVSEPFGLLKTRDLFGAQVNLYQREDIDGLRRWADAVHAHDSGLVGQLQDVGRGDVRPKRKPFSLGPSALPDDLSWTVPHAMSVEEIAIMREDFVNAAETLKRAGFNGVEISSGHGHLHHQFLSPWANHRDDEYGGSRENRIRVLVELVCGFRDACGDDFLVGIRLPGNDGVPGGVDWEESGKIAQALTAACRLDYVNFVHGAQASTLYMHVPDMHGPRGVYVDAISRLRGHCGGVPVASTGRIVEAAQAEALLASQHADFVMLGRALLADPAWGVKARDNRDSEIRKCISCNNCWGEVVQGKPLACDNNPRVGRADEADWRPVRTTAPRQLTIVGGGIAGLEAAWVAAARGHRVTLFSSGAELGGKGRLYASMDGCEAVSSIFDYQVAAAQRAGVDLRISHQASLDDVLSSEPDAVVLACGGEMLWPPQLPVAWRDEGLIPDLWTLITELPRMRREAGTAVLYDFDGTDVTYAAAEALTRRFDRVVLMNPVECLARDEALVKRQAIYHRLLNAGVEILPWSEPSAASDLENGRVVTRNVMSGRETSVEEVALFAYATPRRPRDGLLAPLRAAGLETHIIGDAFIPRSTIAVISEAHSLGERLFPDVAPQEG